MEQILPGIWKITLGEPEALTPLTYREIAPDVAGLDSLAAADDPPFADSDVQFTRTARGCLVELPLDENEDIYGFGLQLYSHRQTGTKKTIRVNSDPPSDTGDSHAPVPFYLSTGGYGVLVNTARYATFHCGTNFRPENTNLSASADATDQANVFRQKDLPGKPMEIEIPTAGGVDIYLFAGPDMLSSLRRYVLFSGGGALPPMWGLGVWYRGHAKHTSENALEQARSFREAGIPCDVFGLEPGWQTHSYPCSYVWDPERFENPEAFLSEMEEAGYRVNLWEHVFVHPASPIHKDLVQYSGDRCVWGGLVPDLSVPEARAIFAGFHESEHAAKGISGFKLDECDHSDFVITWSFPEHTQFPSGLDGEQMHTLIGLFYQRAILDGFRSQGKRTYNSVRASHALAAPYPFVLYSDLYGHREFVRGVVNCGFGGLLWSPEVRDADDAEDLIRRLQTVVCSPQALVNAWYIRHAPWLQFDREKNDRDELLDDGGKLESICRDILRLRMQLLPYLYSAFARYRWQGVPPFRALVLEYPDDPDARDIDDQYFMGDDLLVAPVFAGQTARDVYLPAGDWFDFWTGERLEGGQHTVDVPLDRIPIFVRDGSILPIAELVDHVTADTVFDITARVYGADPRPFRLYEDDGETYEFEQGRCGTLELTWTDGTGNAERTGDDFGRYNVTNWEHIG
jgi:alpha-D-xyloside xylohydrolase